MTARWLALALPFAAVALGGAAPRVSNLPTVLIIGNSQAKLCSEHAKMAAEEKMSPASAVATCTDALRIELLSPYERAATLNNRGVVRLTMHEEAPLAAQDFNEAAVVDPNVGASYVNRGTVLLREHRYQEAIAEFDRSLQVDLEEPWKAYFNRAIARELMDDLPGAYADFMKAKELKPGWEPPDVELARYSVRPKG